MKKQSVFLLAALLSSCTLNSVIFYGKSYPPTQQVDVFLRESDIKRSHEIMGRAVFEEMAMVDSKLIQNHILQAAKNQGADAIIFEDVDVVYRKRVESDDHRQVIKFALVKYND